MSSYQKYDPALFIFEREQSGSARAGVARTGSARAGVASSNWVPLPTAVFSYASNYDPDANGTLIVGTETASCSLKYFGDPAPEDLIYVGDSVRASYADQLIFLGVVESVKLTTSVDTEAQAHGAHYVTELAANLVGAYAAALDHEVTWTELPSETVIDRIRRWVTVTGW